MVTATPSPVVLWCSHREQFLHLSSTETAQPWQPHRYQTESGQRFRGTRTSVPRPGRAWHSLLRSCFELRAFQRRNSLATNAVLGWEMILADAQINRSCELRCVPWVASTLGNRQWAAGEGIILVPDFLNWNSRIHSLE